MLNYRVTDLDNFAGYRISGQISADIKKGWISGQPDIRYNFSQIVIGHNSVPVYGCLKLMMSAVRYFFSFWGSPCRHESSKQCPTHKYMLESSVADPFHFDMNPDSDPFREITHQIRPVIEKISTSVLLFNSIENIFLRTVLLFMG